MSPMLNTSVPTTLSLVVGIEPAIVGGLAGEVRGRDRGLLEPGRHEAVDVAVVLGALADRVDVGIRRLHRVVDGDAAADRDARICAQARCWSGCRCR